MLKRGLACSRGGPAMLLAWQHNGRGPPLCLHVLLGQKRHACSSPSRDTNTNECYDSRRRCFTHCRPARHHCKSLQHHWSRDLRVLLIPPALIALLDTANIESQASKTNCKTACKQQRRDATVIHTTSTTAKCSLVSHKGRLCVSNRRCLQVGCLAVQKLELVRFAREPWQRQRILAR